MKADSPKVLTRRDPDEMSIAPEFRHLLCPLPDGRLLVAMGHEFNPYVQSYMARLDRMGQPYVREVVDIVSVRSAHEDQADTSITSDHTPMQSRAKELLAAACRSRASDIHIRVHKHAAEVLFRVHNDLIKVSGHSREYGERLLATLYAAMTDVSDASYKPHERQDARIGDRDKLPQRLNGVRIATTPTVEGSLMVLRLLYDDTDASHDPRTLGFSDAHAQMLQTMKEQPIGMHIISGPTGSGKSTTLQRVLSGLIAETEGRLHVITVEDPPEYPIDGAVQTPVTNASGEMERTEAFSQAISNSLRLDPDTLMIGEMRDLPSAQLCLRAAMTGHQVWSTVHANNAMSILDRLLDLGLPMPMVTDPRIITGLIAQRLVKVLCPHCKTRLNANLAQVESRLLLRLRDISPELLDTACLQGPGCKHCDNHGTIGRTVVAEIIVPDEEFCRLIRHGEKQLAYEHWIAHGGVTCMQHAIEKIAAGEVDPRMAERVVGHLRLDTPAQPVHAAQLTAMRPRPVVMPPREVAA